MLGDLVYMADAARITLCDGSSLPVAMEADWIRMERAYTATAKPAGSPLHVSFEGHVAKRPTMEGDGTEAAILVTRFIRAWPGENCERSRADASLVETYWRAVLLAGLEAGTVAGRKEPQLRLRAGEAATHAAGDYTATVGCNVVSGRYSVNVASLRFAAGAMTRMACPPPLDALERGLVDTLSRTASWRIKGPTLELFDAGGASVGLFQAVYLKRGARCAVARAASPTCAASFRRSPALCWRSARRRKPGPSPRRRRCRSRSSPRPPCW